MGNFSGWLQRTESSAVNNTLSHLVTDRTVKNNVLNSFSSLLGNCYLMGHSEHKKSHFFPSLFHWGSGKFLSCPKAGSEHVPPYLSCSFAQSIFSQWFSQVETDFQFCLCSSRAEGVLGGGTTPGLAAGALPVLGSAGSLWGEGTAQGQGVCGNLMLHSGIQRTECWNEYFLLDLKNTGL